MRCNSRSFLSARAYQQQRCFWMSEDEKCFNLSHRHMLLRARLYVFLAHPGCVDAAEAAEYFPTGPDSAGGQWIYDWYVFPIIFSSSRAR